MSQRLRTVPSLALIAAMALAAPAVARDLIVIDGPVTAKEVKCNGCVGRRDIGNNAVDSGELRNNAVTSGKLGNNAVTQEKVGTGAVGTRNIQDKSITIEKLADGVLDHGIGPDSVGTEELQDDAVTTSKIDNDAVTFGKLSPKVRDFIPSFDAVEVSVDCRVGESIQDALDALTPGQPATITISGTCNEAVYLIRDDVTLQGDGDRGEGGPTSVIDASELAAPIWVDGARRVTIDGLLLRNGDEDGLAAFRGATLTVTNNVMESNSGDGMFLGLNATARIEGNQIRNNGSAGIEVTFDSSARILDNTIQNNDGNGIEVTNKSSAWIGLDYDRAIGNRITGNYGAGIMQFNGSSTVLRANTIEGNNVETDEGGISLYRSTAALIGDNRITLNNYGIVVSQSSLELILEGLKDDTIANNAKDGILAIDGSSLVIREGFFEGNGTGQGGDINGISVNDNSMMRIRGATIQNNVGSGIVLRRGGGAAFQTPAATVTGHSDQEGEYDLACRGLNQFSGETHYSGDFGTGGSLEGIDFISENCVQVDGTPQEF